jgi:hypothetical protein
VGYLSCEQYARRIGITKQTVFRAVRVGKIPPDHCLYSRKAGHGILIDWNKTAFQFVAQLQKNVKPADFDPTLGYYKPLDEAEWIAFTNLKPPKKPGRQKNLAAQKMPDNMHDVKLLNEQLKAEKNKIELMRAKNELIDVADAIAVNKQIAVEIRKAWDAAEKKLIPLVTASTSVKEVKDLFTKVRGDVFAKIGELEGLHGNE